MLEGLQKKLLADAEAERRGCRIRRETQELFYMCCDGVRVRMNEGKKEILVEIPIEKESGSVLGLYKRKCSAVENVIEALKST